MNRSINLIAKNSLKVAAVTTFTIAACLAPKTAQAQIISAGSTTAGCSSGLCTINTTQGNLFEFNRLDFGNARRIRFIVPGGFTRIRVRVFNASTINGLITASRRVDLFFTANAPITFGQNARYYPNNLSFIAQNLPAGSSGSPRAVPENPIGGLLAAGAIGVVLLLKRRRRCNQLAQNEITGTPRQHEV